MSRNKNRFPDEFYFQLTDEEMDTFRSQNVTKKEEYETRGGRYKSEYNNVKIIGIFIIVF